ncbi:LysR substrate-binding domain-containing protein [Mesorhizobium sp. M0092]|uniref:LysR substrate-binding domain-containing protein n=1 Tax=unclassified Mesorhizobium TaxID=325217 RepID=UPI00333BA703
MLDLNDLYYFAKVVEKQSFTAASHALGRSKSNISRRIIELEKQLGVCLIQRTSRSFAVTDIGQEVYQFAVGMLVEAESAEGAAARRLAEPSGTVRFTCSIGMAQSFLAELLPRFLLTFPKVNIIQHATNRYVDLVDEGFDLALRGHVEPLPDSSLIQRRFAPTPWHLFAAPIYLAGAGTPTSPQDLADHGGLALNGLTGGAVWKLRNIGGETVLMPLTARLRSDDLGTLKQAAIAGLGIVALPAYFCQAETGNGILQRILPQWTAGEAGITLLSPSGRSLLPAVRAFSDYLAAEFFGRSEMMGSRYDTRPDTGALTAANNRPPIGR